MDGIRGSAGRFKGASAGISASAPEFGRPASVSAGIAGFGCARGKKGPDIGAGLSVVAGDARRERAGRAEH